MRLTILLISAATLAGCMNTGQPTVQSLPTVGQRTSDASTLALSCNELATRSNNITVRVRELEAEQQRAARANALTDAVVGVGLTAVLGAGAQGGLNGIRAASATAQGVDAVRRAEQGQGSIANVTDSLALLQRSAELQRAYVEKGC